MILDVNLDGDDGETRTQTQILASGFIRKGFALGVSADEPTINCADESGGIEVNFVKGFD